MIDILEASATFYLISLNLIGYIRCCNLVLVSDVPNKGSAQHRGSILASHPAAPSLIPSITEKIQRKNIDFAAVNEWGLSEESGQWLENTRQDSSKLIVGLNPCPSTFLNQIQLANIQIEKEAKESIQY